MNTARELAPWIDERRREVEAALTACLPGPPATPPVIRQAMEYSLLAGGKRLRPLLVLASAEAAAVRVGTSAADARALALPVACAVEMIHTYSLVHDDLPAMDNDTLRRGRPTAHVVFGEGLAILAGDALLTEAFALLAREPDATTARSSSGAADAIRRRQLEVVALLAEAAGAAGMVGGQALDLQAAEPGAPALDAEGLRAMHSRKTGALIRGAALAGGTIAGAARPLLEALDTYGTNLGLAFQIVDDILDVEGASRELGKTAGKDAAAGKPTYPALYGLDASRQLAARSVDAALAALERTGLAGQLPAIARWVTDRSS